MFEFFHYKFHSVLFLIFLLFSCSYRNEKGTVDPLSTEEGFLAVQRSIIEPKCISCHAGPSAAMAIDFSSFSKIMESNTVVPYQPEKSRFYTSIESGRMPKGSEILPGADIRRVYEWIKDGALEGQAPAVPSPPPEPNPNPTLKSIQNDFVDRKCVSCHLEATPQNRHIKLKNLLEVVEGTGPSGHVRKIIKPGCPKESFFHSIMREGKMPPPPAVKPSQEWLKVMAEWITSLKPGAICDDEPGED